MKKMTLRERRRRKCILVVWTLLGVIGLVWLLSLPVSFLGRLLWGAETIGDGSEGKEGKVHRVWGEDTESTGGMDIGEGNHGTVGDMGGMSAPNADSKETEELSGVITGWSEKALQEEAVRRRCKELYDEYSTLLVLVNREHELEEGSYEGSLRSICNGRLQASDYLYEDLVDMLAAAKEAGYQYWIASAYRSRARQQELVDEDVSRYMTQDMSYAEALEKTHEQTMPAGKSEHETGLALDMLCSENVNMDISQAQEPGNRWLTEHAYEYGFILRYPEDKEDITGISYEPWHFRYVGKAAAEFLHEQGWTLEEFWECLRTCGHSSTQ